MSEFESKFDLSVAEFVAMGNDSSVYRLDHFVAKQYPYLDIDTLIAYRDLTNTMNKSLCQNPLVVNGELFGEKWKAVFSVVPILEVEDVNPVRAYSSYVPGPNHQQLNLYGNWGMDVDFKDEEQSNFFGKIRANSEFNPFLEMTRSDLLATRTALETGIYPHIVLINTKFKVRTDEKTIDVIITDLSADIASIEFPHKAMVSNR